MENFLYLPYDDDPTKYYKITPSTRVAGGNCATSTVSGVTYSGVVLVYLIYEYEYANNRFKCNFKITSNSGNYKPVTTPATVKLYAGNNLIYNGQVTIGSSDILSDTFYVNCNNDGSVDNLYLKSDITVTSQKGKEKNTITEYNSIAYKIYTTLKYKILNVWRSAIAKLKVNGIWKRCIVWKKINGEWKKGK